MSLRHLARYPQRFMTIILRT